MIRYRHVDPKRPNLFIGDRLASSLRLAPLRAELERLKIPGIEAHMGKAQLLDLYEARITSSAEALRGPGKAGRAASPIGYNHMRQAAAMLEAAASAGE